MQQPQHNDNPATASGEAAAQSRRHRLLYVALGWTCVVLGLVGAFLPLMPTTVFLLIAAWAFSRSSPRWHRWLREHARFGETIRAWEEHHAMPRRAKRIAFVALAASYGITAWIFGPFSWAAIIGGLCIFGVAVYIAHIPVLQAQEKRSVRT
jgi:uncharacterized membrane protein YbaN (DUF454 family)